MHMKKHRVLKIALLVAAGIVAVSAVVDAPFLRAVTKGNPETREAAAQRSAAPLPERVWKNAEDLTAATGEDDSARQVYNPYLPLDEYIPDGEPHVFGDRVYVYGSHDKANSDRFCVQDYVVYSAPVNDLTVWTNHGVSYQKSQDPRSRDEKLVDFYAPDCVRGNDGRYYLYYFSAGPNTKAFGPMSVAVSEKPEGPFDYLGDIRYPDGSPVLKYLTNDPAVINDNGRIFLYYGWGLGKDFGSKILAPLFHVVLNRLCHRSLTDILHTKPSVLGCAVAELETDMLTVKSEPKLVLDSKTTAPKDSPLYDHAFYEAASIRKFGDLYYLIYSCEADNALAYATSRFPDKDFTYRGLIISNTDLGYNGNKDPKAPASTIHGSVENINGQYYVFYHRSTNNTDFSRQGCAEPVEMEADGTFKQVEITSCGLNGGPLIGQGAYPAAICCNLTCPGGIKFGWGKGQKYPRVCEKDHEVYVCDLTDGTQVGYKYFLFSNLKTVSVLTKGSGTGHMEIRTAEDGPALGSIEIRPFADWTESSVAIQLEDGIYALFLRYVGSGKTDLLQISFA